MELSPINYKVPFDCGILPTPAHLVCETGRDKYQNQIGGDCNALPMAYQDFCRSLVPYDATFGYGNEGEDAVTRECAALGPRSFYQCVWEKESNKQTNKKMAITTVPLVPEYAAWDTSTMTGPRDWEYTNLDWVSENRWISEPGTYPRIFRSGGPPGSL